MNSIATNHHMRIWLYFVATAVAFSACARPSAPNEPALAADVLDRIKAPAGVVIAHRAETYAVTGTDRATIRAQLHVPDGTLLERNYAGLYKWQLTWRYETGREGTLCRVTRAAVTLTSIVTLPEWTAAATADPGLVTEWARFRRALAVHEHGHRELAYAGAGRARKAIESIPQQACSSIDADVRIAAEPILNAMKLEQARYDQSTSHGATQGATF